MDGKILLYDSNDVKIGETYIRRARQLVKQQRATWTDDSQKAIKFSPGMETLDDAPQNNLEELPMYKYRSEAFQTSFKLVNDSAGPEDLDRLDSLLNERANDGWEFVCHSYMTNVFGFRSAILVAFKKPK